MTVDEVLGHTQLTAYTANLVLEEPFQRFAELQMHLLGQTAHVMVALDDLTRDVQRLDAVGIDSTLSEPTGIGNILGFGVKDLNEVTTNDLTFLLRFGDTSEVTEELL